MKKSKRESLSILLSITVLLMLFHRVKNVKHVRLLVPVGLQENLLSRST
jgi:hypothetical protein